MLPPRTIAGLLLSIQLLAVLRTVMGHRVREALADLERLFVIEESSSLSQKCQYAGIDNVRPEYEDLVSVCLAGSKVDPQMTQACEKYSKAHYGRVVTLPYDEVSMGMCEEICSSSDVKAVGQCRGYVVREDYVSTATGKPSCWLIAENAKNASSYWGEIRLAKTAKVENLGHKVAKKTFVKESCKCGTRFVHVTRAPQQSQLAFAEAVVKDLNGLSKKTGLDAAQEAKLSSAKEAIESLSNEIEAIRPVLLAEGIYDYLPMTIPHRIYRGKLRYLPNSLVARLGKKFADIGREGASAMGGQKTYGDYWQSPVKVSNIYKKPDLSAILYQCYDKSRSHQAWYLASKDLLLQELAAILNVAAGEIQGRVTDERGLQLGLFFSLKCMGYRLGNDGQVFRPLQEGEDLARQAPMNVKISSQSLRNGHGTWSVAHDAGCFENEKDATEAREERVVEEVLAAGDSPALDRLAQGDGKARLKLLKNQICEKLLTGDSKSVIGKLEIAGTVAKYQNTLGAVWNVADKASAAWSYATKWMARRKQTPEDTSPAPESPADRMTVDKSQLLKRTAELIEAMKQVVMRIQAIAETDDPQLKLFCAREMLEVVQQAGGIWPKISQNLAMRPDVVPDDFARNKLKETQSGNKNLGKSKTLQYIEEVRPEIDLPGLGKVFLLDFMKYERFLSAGSVGQVDVYSLKEGTEAAKVFKQRVIPDDWMGRTDKFIVKTVFKSTEELYTSDWQLMKLFFTKLADYLPAKFSIIWATLKNMETSIFDEFDLGKEAKATTRGREMLRQFTEEHGSGVRVTTPLGLSTTSKYVMVQTFAQGLPLSSYLEQIKGQKDRLAAWRTKIYASILNVFGYTSVRHGFFQSDPHPGNWFWDGPTETLSLIDWGGVENWVDEHVEPRLKQGHCNLARLYARMGSLSQTWEICDAVVISSKTLPAIAGTYLRTGVSIYAVRSGEPALLMGHGYALSYTKKEGGLNLWFDGMDWQISEVHPEAMEIYTTLAKITINNNNAASAGDQSFFGKVFGKPPESMNKGEGKTLQVEELKKGESYKTPKMHQVLFSSARGEVCSQVPDRTQAYQLSASALGITLKTPCTDFRFINTDTDALREYMHTDKIALVCIYTNEEGNQVGKVGVPPAEYPIDEDNLIVRITDHSESYDVSVPMMVGEDAFSLAQGDLPPRVLKRQSTAPESALEVTGIGNFIGPVVGDDAEQQLTADSLKFSDPETELLFLDQTQRAYAVSASLFDSDITEAAILAIQSRQGMALFQPGKVPEEFTLFARCVVVFHGMLADVVKENLARLVPIPFVQWLLQSRAEDRFFTSWRRYAEAFLKDAGSRCPSSPLWQALGQ